MGSEEVQHAPFILIASACVDPGVQISPTGQYWLLTEGQSPRVSLHTADLRRVRDLVSTDSDEFFLTDTLITGGRIAGDHYLVPLDDPTAPRIPIAAYHRWDPTLVPRDVPTRWYRLIPQKTVVYIIVPNDLARSVVFSSVDADAIIAWSRRSGGAPPIRDFVIDRQTQAFAHPWQATTEGIRDTATGAYLVAVAPRIANREALQPRGWLAGDRLVLYQYPRTYLLAGGSGAMWLPTANFLPVPQPILALDVPDELLQPPPTP